MGPDEVTTHQLVQAEAWMARTLQRLTALRRAALYGSYDVDVFERAVADYRAAELTVLELRRQQALEEALVDAPEPPMVEDSAAAPIEPTPRLLFARWLAQTGRLSG